LRLRLVPVERERLVLRVSVDADVAAGPVERWQAVRRRGPAVVATVAAG
jgi:hypothetical protein